MGSVWEIILENERRSRARDSVKRDPPGELTLHVDEQPFAIRALHDVSPFGLGLLVDAHIPNGSEISLRYRHREIDIKVCGSVVWSQADESSGVFKVGVCLKADKMLPNVEFFNAIMG